MSVTDEVIATALVALLDAQQIGRRTTLERLATGSALLSKFRYQMTDTKRGIIDERAEARPEKLVIAHGGLGSLESTYSLLPGGMVSWTVPENKIGELQEIHLQASTYIATSVTRYAVFLVAIGEAIIATDITLYAATRLTFGGLRLKSGDVLSVAAKETATGANAISAYATIIGKEIG